MSAVRSGQLLWRACCAGQEPAESLDVRDREDLVAGLVERGWSDVDIVVLTRMSTYTTARIGPAMGWRWAPAEPPIGGRVAACPPSREPASPSPCSARQSTTSPDRK